MVVAGTGSGMQLDLLFPFFFIFLLLQSQFGQFVVISRWARSKSKTTKKKAVEECSRLESVAYFSIDSRYQHGL